jgi:hypothetical protein
MGTSGTLYFASERSGYQQLYAVSLESSASCWLRFKDLEQCKYAGAEFWLSRNQATMFEEAAKCHLRKEKMNGFIADEAVKLVVYENEGHGFQLASSKKHSLEE